MVEFVSSRSKVAEAANKVAVETLQLLSKRSQMPEGILDPRVKVDLYRLHHLPRGQPGLQQRSGVKLQLCQSRRQLHPPTHMVKAIPDPQVLVRVRSTERGDRGAIELQSKALCSEHATGVPLD